jgi:hypothetical protein
MQRRLSEMPVPHAKIEQKAFAGMAGAVTLQDLIRIECSILATRAVRLDRGDISGRIYFAHGRVVHAEVGELTGEPALFEMLGWAGGDLVIADGLQPREETISRSWQALLADAAKPPTPNRRKSPAPKARRGSGLWQR